MSLSALKEALAQIQPLMPFMMMSGVISGYTLSFFTILPVLIKFIEWVMEKFAPTAVFEKEYKVSVSAITHANQKNWIYEHITFIIKREKLAKNGYNFQIDDYNLVTNRKIFAGKLTKYTCNTVLPVITLSPGFSTPFETDKFKVRIRSEAKEDNNKKSHYYIITARTQNDIDEFMEYLQSIQQDFCDFNFGDPDETLGIYDYKDGWRKTTVSVKKTFKNIFLDKDVKRAIKHNLKTFEASEEQYDQYGIAYKIGFLFYGTPGNGKTSTILAIAQHYKRNIYKIDLSYINSDDFMAKIRGIPMGSIVLMEDIDTTNITHAREEKEEEEKKTNFWDRGLGKLLEILDGYCYLRGCIIIMTSNHPERLDKALIRPGRIDHKIEFKNATREQISQMIKYYFNEEIVLEHDVDISVSELINTIILPNLSSPFVHVLEALRASRT